MRFKNINAWPLDFNLDGHVVKAAPGAEVEVPDRLASAVAARGIKLEPLEPFPDADALTDTGPREGLDPKREAYFQRRWDAREREHAAELARLRDDHEEAVAAIVTAHGEEMDALRQELAAAQELLTDAARGGDAAEAAAKVASQESIVEPGDAPPAGKGKRSR